MFEIVPHVADVRLRIEADSLEELFSDAMLGMYAIMRGTPEPDAKTLHRTINVEESADTTSLLVDFLNEVLHRAHVAREMYREIRMRRLDSDSLTAEVAGTAPVDFEEDVKAVTYHEAEVRREGNLWVTTLVFDL